VNISPRCMPLAPDSCVATRRNRTGYSSSSRLALGHERRASLTKIFTCKGYTWVLGDGGDGRSNHLRRGGHGGNALSRPPRPCRMGSERSEPHRFELRITRIGANGIVIRLREPSGRFVARVGCGASAANRIEELVGTSNVQDRSELGARRRSQSSRTPAGNRTGVSSYRLTAILNDSARLGGPEMLRYTRGPPQLSRSLIENAP